MEKLKGPPSPEKLQMLQSAAKMQAFDNCVLTVEKELGHIDWNYPVNDDHPFNASELALAILNRTADYGLITDKKTENIYFYNEASGVYHKDGEIFLRVLIDKVLGSNNKTHRTNETIEILKTKTYATITPSMKIAVENGLLDIETGTLEKFTKYEFVTNKLQAPYLPEAKNEPWEAFMNQVCPDDKDILQEWSGYLLIKGYPFHAIMWLYGPTGRNGKGTWARTMQAILGEDNYSSVSIDEFDGKHRFAVYNLHDSLFNVCSEPRTDRTLTIETLQMLTGQDAVSAEKKGVQERFLFKNGAKITVMGNKFPNVDKPTDAFWDRLKLCKFPLRFTGKDQIQDIEKLWLSTPTLRAGILNWMLIGARRLFKNHCFTSTKTQQETVIQFKRASDSIGAFMMECASFSQEYIAPKAPAFDDYKIYCDVIGVAPESTKEFADRLRNTPRIRDTSTRIGGVKTKVWGGVKFKIPEALLTEEDGEKDDPEGQQTLDPHNTGTTGTAGTANDAYTIYKKPESKNLEGVYVSKSVPKVPPVPDEGRVCGDCNNFKQPACQHPQGPEAVKADSCWANCCHGWNPKLLGGKLDKVLSTVAELQGSAGEVSRETVLAALESGGLPRVEAEALVLKLLKDCKLFEPHEGTVAKA